MEKQEKLVREMGGVGISFILRKQGKVMECLVKEPLSLDSTEINRGLHANGGWGLHVMYTSVVADTTGTCRCNYLKLKSSSSILSLNRSICIQATKCPVHRVDLFPIKY